MGATTRIGRRITTTTCKCVVMEGRDIKHIDVKLSGSYGDIARATGAVKRQLGTEQVLVESMAQSSAYYSMPIKTFLEYADKVSEQDEQEQE